MKEIRTERRNDLEGKILILKTETGEETCSEKMLRYNHVEGILPLEIYSVNGIQEYHYQITGLKSMEERTEKKPVLQKEIAKWMRQILKILQTGKNYLLQEEDFLLSPTCLFLDEQENLFLCYLEGYQEELYGQLTELLGYWLDKLDYGQEHDVSWSYGLYQLCRDRSGCERLGRYLREKQKTEEYKEKREPVDEIPEQQAEREEVKEKMQNRAIEGKEAVLLAAGIVFAAAALYQSGLMREENGSPHLMRWGMFLLLSAAVCSVIYGPVFLSWRKKKRDENSFDWGEHPGYRQEDSTVSVLASQRNTETIRETSPAVRVYLEAAEGERTEVDSFPFYIGKEKHNQLVLEPGTVSREHAVLLEADGCCYIKDMHSTNGTKVNGLRLDPGGQKELQDEDLLEFAREKFLFRRKYGNERGEEREMYGRDS